MHKVFALLSTECINIHWTVYYITHISAFYGWCGVYLYIFLYIYAVLKRSLDVFDSAIILQIYNFQQMYTKATNSQVEIIHLCQYTHRSTIITAKLCIYCPSELEPQRNGQKKEALSFHSIFNIFKVIYFQILHSRISPSYPRTITSTLSKISVRLNPIRFKHIYQYSFDRLHYFVFVFLAII